MRRYAVDTNIFLYARGSGHPYREPCRQLIDAARRTVVTLEASVELAQEFGHVLLRRGLPREDAMDEVDDVRTLCRLHPFDREVLSRAVTLLRSSASLGTRDAVHAATAIQAGLSHIVSADRALDDVPGLTRLDPIHDSRDLLGE